MQDNVWRLAFASFLDRFVDGRESSTDWSWYIVRHFYDEELEAIRRDVVRVVVKHPPFESVTADEKDAKLREWSRVLRDSCS
jgi:hypothetical protein